MGFQNFVVINKIHPFQVFEFQVSRYILIYTEIYMEITCIIALTDALGLMCGALYRGIVRFLWSREMFAFNPGNWFQMDKKGIRYGKKMLNA